MVISFHTSNFSGSFLPGSHPVHTLTGTDGITWKVRLNEIATNNKLIAILKQEGLLV